MMQRSTAFSATFIRFVPFALLVLATVIAPTRAQNTIPTSFELDPTARTAMDAAWLTDAERQELRIFHGVWEPADLDMPTRQARAALMTASFESPSLTNPAVPATLRAEAFVRRGDLQAALTLLADDDSPTAGRIRAAALEGLGRYDEALEAVRTVIAARNDVEDNAENATEVVKAMIIRARLQGQPSRDFQGMLDELGRVRTNLDRLYWPARLTEARLLADKHKADEAFAAIIETLHLNPRCSEAWLLLGQLSIERFDFDSCQNIITALRDINPSNPLADLLDIEYRLVRDDPDSALDTATQLLDRLPRLRAAHELRAAALALQYDEPAMRAALAQCDELSPGSPTAYATVGRFLSLFRQYDLASEMLQEAIRRQPNWPEPQIELGLMELQAGRDSVALDVLQSAVDLDRFNKRAANSLFLLEEIADYHTIETEHFIIRYKPGIDEVLVRTMPEELEKLHEIVTGRLEFEPDRKTIIEVLPDHQRFAVRITGMPWIHTVAACTGPVIAMEVPREGHPTEHFGPFDWRRVLQHEYTHTVTLAQTQNRIPHWFTEAIAVRMELAPRDYDRCVMLADALENGTLFSLEEIKWAFVRPREPGDRGKAYAQGYWMVEFMEERFGNSAIIRLLNEYFDGVREADAMPRALGVSREAFYQAFLEWAHEQVHAWGLSPEPSLEQLLDDVRADDPELALQMLASRQARLDVITRRMAMQIGRPGERSRDELTAAKWPPIIKPDVTVTDALLNSWRDQHPDHPDLLEMEIRRRLDRRDGVIEAGDVEMLETLIARRPVDPYPHRKLAQYWLGLGDAARAVPHLEELYMREQYNPVYAVELGAQYRELGEFDTALARITRAMHINPYHAATRELAAAIAVQAGRLDVARTHIEALMLLEPDRPRHQKRLERINALIAERAQG